MGTHTTLLVLGTLAVLHAVTSSNSTNINLPESPKTNERFRRLIPYMTFYFAQQNYGNRPQYQELSGTSQILPITNNKLSSIPQYQGNLVVPSTYLLRYTPKQTQAQNSQNYNTPIQQVSNERLKQLIPRPFSPSNNGNNINIQSSNTYTNPSSTQTYQAKPINEYVNPRIEQQNNYDSAKARTIAQIINILQAIRKLPQRVTPENREQTMAQLIDILQQTNQLPTSTVNSLTKILNRIPQYNKVYQSLANPVTRPPQLTPVTSRPKYIIYANPNNPITKSLIQTYTNPSYINKIPQISTPVPEQVQSIDDYENYDDEPKEPPPIHKPKIQIVSRPIPLIPQTIPIPQVSTLSPVPTLTQNVNELQNYDYSSEVVDAPDNENIKKPILPSTVSAKKPETTTPIPNIAQNSEDLQTYNYAAKQPKQNYYRGHTTTQIFPAPNAEGGTPGRPGVDYPTYSSIPETSFTCKNQRYKGFFGDPDTSCQVWHYCDLNGGQASFLCPNGTIFSQVGLTCDWWFNVRCSSTPQLYVLNERLYKYILPVAPSFPEDFSGPLVDQYLTLKFQELEKKKKNKENSNKTETAKPSKE